MKITTFAALVPLLMSLRAASAQPLGRDDIQRGVLAVRPAVDECLRIARVSSVVKVRLEIMDGRVVTAEVRDAGRATACVERAVRRARFRRAPQRMTILYPFVSRSPSVSSRPPAVKSGLSRAQVSRGISAVRAAVDRCRPPSGNRVVVTVRIDIARGRVASARGTSTAAGASTIACVERAVAQASFPPAEPMTVRYPFLLH